MGVFYWLAKPAARDIFDKAVWILAAAATVNYMFFGNNVGTLSSTLKYENEPQFSLILQFLNIAAVLVLAAVLWLIAEKIKKHIFDVFVIGIAAIVSMSAFNIVKINASIAQIDTETQQTSSIPTVNLSKDGKNVIVLMLDRAIGEYVPYIFNEKPELKEQFSGFKYYSNVISFGGHTNFAIPALLGGYEYTPAEMNKRDSEPIVNKHNEALKVMPALFDSNGFDVTVCNPVYANYRWIPDLSVYDDYPDIKSYITNGSFSDVFTKEKFIQNNSRNFFCYSIYKSVPLCMQKVLYDNGNYNSSEGIGYMEQKTNGLYKASGLKSSFIEQYNLLKSLPNMTNIKDGGSSNTFLFMACEMTHEPMMLQEPDYVPSANVDNTEYEANHKDRFTLNGRTLKMNTEKQVTHYQINMAAMLQLGKWFDFMKENGVYDNTRIILVSDHGSRLQNTDELILADGEDVSGYFPLLLVKDFNSKGFESCDEFMTNADVPTLAASGLIDDPVNPFTDKKIDSSAKFSGEQYIITSVEWDIDKNSENTFLPSTWFSVHDSIWNKSNWKKVADNAVLPNDK